MGISVGKFSILFTRFFPSQWAFILFQISANRILRKNDGRYMFCCCSDLSNLLVTIYFQVEYTQLLMKLYFQRRNFRYITPRRLKSEDINAELLLKYRKFIPARFLLSAKVNSQDFEVILRQVSSHESFFLKVGT